MSDFTTPLPEPNYDDDKEVYAFFGLAFYWAQVLEQGLLNLAAVLHLNEVRAITREVFEQTFENLDPKTLGQLLKATRSLMRVPAEADKALSDLLEKRNDLAHRFFKRHSQTILSRAGRKDMIDELRHLTDALRRGDKIVEKLYMPLWARYGATEEYVNREVERMRERARARDDAL